MKRKIRDKRLYEYVTIKGNKGIPGEHGDDKDKEKKYLSDVEKRAYDRLGMKDLYGAPEYLKGVKIRNMLKEFVYLTNKSRYYSSGKEKQLEKLAIDIIKSEYGSILDGVKLDIKLVTQKSGEIQKMMKDNDIEMPQIEILDDPDIKNEVDKRKILNCIAQGEGLNTKRILALPEVKDELAKIYGSTEKAKEIQEIWLKITTIAQRFDWLIPIKARTELFRFTNHSDIAGAVSVDWINKTDVDDEDKINSMKNIFDKLKNGDVDDINEFEEDLKNVIGDTIPVIKVRAIDFPMLIHEAVKGIYELIIASGIPDNKEIAEIVILNTSSIEDEFEEFRYGPEIASDLRDFINNSKVDIDKYPNIRERFCGVLSTMPADEFLFLMKNILMETPYARKRVDEILTEIIRELDDYYNEIKYNDLYDIQNQKTSDVENIEDVDYSKMSQSEIKDLIDKALDDKDYDKVKLLSKYLKESLSKKMYK